MWLLRLWKEMNCCMKTPYFAVAEVLCPPDQAPALCCHPQSHSSPLLPFFICHFCISESSVRQSAAGAGKWLPGEVQSWVVFGRWWHFGCIPVKDMRDGKSQKSLPSNSLAKLQTLLEVMEWCRASRPVIPSSRHLMWCPPHVIHPLFLPLPMISSSVIGVQLILWSTAPAQEYAYATLGQDLLL